LGPENCILEHRLSGYLNTPSKQNNRINKGQYQDLIVLVITVEQVAVDSSPAGPAAD
jgi:hypothetical protein